MQKQYNDKEGQLICIEALIQFNFIYIVLLTKELCHKAALQRTLGQQWQEKLPGR